MKRITTKPAVSMRNFERRAPEILAELQKTLLPNHASDVIGINVDKNDYVLGSRSEDVWKNFRERWPNNLGYFVRVNGGPVVKFHGK